jgi:hypothetical protein
MLVNVINAIDDNSICCIADKVFAKKTKIYIFALAEKFNSL